MDIVLRAMLAFFFVLLLTRVVGRRELSSLEPFDLILLVMIGDLVQQGVTQNDFSVTGMLLAGTTIALLTMVISFTSFKVPIHAPCARRRAGHRGRGRAAVPPQPRAEPDHDRRAAGGGAPGGIASIADVRWAVLETSGKISFIEK